MIFKQLILRNFGVFSGEQVFSLAPLGGKGSTKPIILIGGINGGGKTTILDAIQLVLYGGRAPCCSKAGKNYHDFLRESIHRNCELAEGSEIRLSFSYAGDGQDHSYEVSRFWSVQNGRLKEQVTVSKDGQPDSWLSRSWNQLVEDLIPLGIAQLCFFDAEKIRFIAEDGTNNQSLGEAVKSLLGLDLAERLLADAAILEERVARRNSDRTSTEDAANLDAAYSSKQSEIDDLVQDLGSLENFRQSTALKLKQIEETFSRIGGRHWEEREMHHRKLGELQQTLRATETNGISLASTELPLNLISSLLRDVAVQSEKETIASENETIEKLLVDRDERLLVFLEHKNAGAEMQNLVHEFMEEDRAHRNTVQDLETRLILSPEAKRLLDQILEHGLSKKSCECERLLEALENTRNELEAVQRLVAATPREETARKVAQELKEASAELASYDQKKRQLEKRLSSLRSERETIEKQLKRLRRNLVEEEILEEEDSRMGRLLIRTQETMKDFLQCSLAKKIDRLAQLITESLRYLMRKKTLIGYVQVDPETFVITLFDESGHSLPKQRLSEGEKQILAISVLWGLSRASKRQIPTIIDTPMARLDVKHREALLKRYFPHASNQVIVLSTDTEVDSRYFTMLEPHIARAYHLEYDDDKKATTAQEGYFWNPSAPQIAHQGVGS